MESLNSLGKFFAAIDKDPRINSTHICVYAALLQYGNMQQTSPLQLFSHELMRLAKISSGKTYYKSLRELSQYGYLKYEPSYHRNQRSKVYLTAI